MREHFFLLNATLGNKRKLLKPTSTVWVLELATAVTYMASHWHGRALNLWLEHCHFSLNQRSVSLSGIFANISLL